MGRLRLALPPLLAAAALLCLAAAAWQGWQAWRMAQANRQIRDGAAAAGAPAMVVFARARRLEQQGEAETALRVYGEAEALGDEQMRAAVHLNCANILLRKAAQIAARESWVPQAVTLAELAKRGYRDVLRAQPDNWSARYNLELAQLLVADRDDPGSRPQGQDERAGEANGKDQLGWTDMIGALRGTH